MLCPNCKQAEMREVQESSPLNTTLKCLSCGTQAVKAKIDTTSATGEYLAVFREKPDGSLEEVNLSRPDS